MFNIGIECESIEGQQSWGVGRIIKKLLEEIANRPELAEEFRFFLYFKSRIPSPVGEFKFLNNPIFVKKIILKRFHILKNVRINSFSLYYYIFLPIKLWFERLDMMFFPNYMLSPLFRGKSLVMLTEDIYHEMRRSDLPWRYKLAYKIFAGWWAAKHATKIMAISETSKRELTKLFHIEPERIVVNRLGVDMPRIKNYELRIENECSQSTNHFLPTTNYILYVGQAFPRRHLRETMLAFELLISKPESRVLNPVPLRLVAIGYDKYNPPIIKKLAENINQRLHNLATSHVARWHAMSSNYDFCGNRIIYKEYVSEEELAALYTGARCVVYVSSKEAFGLPPLEGLAYGTVPVVADEPINHEIYEGRAFLVKQPITPESIAETIKEALTDETKRQEIVANANKVLGKYTWQRHTEMFLRIIRNLTHHA